MKVEAKMVMRRMHGDEAADKLDKMEVEGKMAIRAMIGDEVADKLDAAVATYNEEISGRNPPLPIILWWGYEITAQVITFYFESPPYFEPPLRTEATEIAAAYLGPDDIRSMSLKDIAHTLTALIGVRVHRPN